MFSGQLPNMSLSEENKQKRNKPCENCRAHRRKCKVSQGTQCDRCMKMNLACVFKFTAKPTVIKKPVPTSKKNRMIEQVRIMEQDIQHMEEQLKSLNVNTCMQQQACNNNSSHSNSSDSSIHSNSSISSISSVSSNSITDSTFSNSSIILCTDNENNYTDDQQNLLRHSKRTKYERHHNNEWQLTVSQGPQGMRFQTSIKNMADITTFLTETFRYFTASPSRTPNYHADRSHQQLAVTNKQLQVERVLHSFFKQKDQARPAISLHEAQEDAVSRNFIRKQLVRCYFSCAGLTNPIFSRPYYLPIIEAHPNSLASNAIAAYVGCIQCKHAAQLPWPTAREEVTELFRLEAKEQLQDLLFDEEPSILIAGAMMLLAQCAFIALQNKEGRLYTSLAWRMALQLKDRYADTLRQLTPTTPVTPRVAEAESWRRLFYAVRYLEINMCMIYDGLQDFSSVLFDHGIGLPMVLGNEKGDLEEAISVIHHVVRLHNCQMSSRNDQLKYQLFAGNINSISIGDIESLENQLIQFWRSLPSELKLSNSPLEYLQTDTIQQCKNPYVIYLNQLYYAYWLALQTRLMQVPSATTLVGANMERFDGDRALLIVSICCDALSKIFHVLYCRLPCTVELHWLLIASDAMSMLKESANPYIKARAQKNLKVTLRVLKQRVQRKSSTGVNNDEYSMWKSMLPNQSPTNSISTSTSSSSLAGSEADSVHSDETDSQSTSSEPFKASLAYISRLEKTVDTYFPGYEQQSTT